MIMLFWAHKGEIIIYERRSIDFTVLNTSNWSTKTIKVPINDTFNDRFSRCTVGSNVIMSLYSCKPDDASALTIERVAHMQ